MPIYAYRCAACGHSKDVLQKLSDPALTQCPACGAEGFAKQLTAAGFQLKGSGWYVTDFKGGNNPPPKKEDGAAEAGEKPAEKAADKTGAEPAAGATSAEKVAPASGDKSDKSSKGDKSSEGSKSVATAAPAPPPAATPGPSPASGG